MEDRPIMLLAAGNLGLEGVHKAVELLQPIFSSLVSLGQVAVAIATVIYLVRKTHLLGKSKKPRNHEKNTD